MPVRLGTAHPFLTLSLILYAVALILSVVIPVPRMCQALSYLCKAVPCASNCLPTADGRLQASAGMSRPRGCRPTPRPGPCPLHTPLGLPTVNDTILLLVITQFTFTFEPIISHRNKGV